MKNNVVPVLQALAAKKGLKLLAGKGNEGDTLQSKIIYVYDTTEFPFHPAELYHQYHNDMGVSYGNKYAALRNAAEQRGVIALSMCPGDSRFW